MKLGVKPGGAARPSQDIGCQAFANNAGQTRLGCQASAKHRLPGLCVETFVRLSQIGLVCDSAGGQGLGTLAGPLPPFEEGGVLSTVS